MGYVIFLFVFFVGGGLLIGKTIGCALFPKNEGDYSFSLGDSVIQ